VIAAEPARPSAPAEALTVAAQIGRPPREPWRTAARCAYGFPTVIVSPAVLCDATPFPSYAWLTCPWLSGIAGAEESEGAAARWSARVARDGELAARLRAVDALVRDARRTESGGTDACAAVGLAGQRDPLRVKCVHAHVALALLGLGDPIGEEVLRDAPQVCADKRCATLTPSGPDGRTC